MEFTLEIHLPADELNASGNIGENAATGQYSLIDGNYRNRDGHYREFGMWNVINA